MTKVDDDRASCTWDLFISHAGEDKDAVARPLAEILRARGLVVWYDEYELGLGDPLRRRIEEGLTRSRYGVVILSPAFFAKKWPQHELDGLFHREDGRSTVILPVWHGIDHADLEQIAPTLADRRAVSTASGLDKVADEIFAAVRGPSPTAVSRNQRPLFRPSAVDIGHLRGDFALHPRARDVLRCIGDVLRSVEYPRAMSLNGTSVPNPIYDTVDAALLERVTQGGVRTMPLDMYLIKAQDVSGEPVLLQYFSDSTFSGWQCWLFPHGFRPGISDPAERFAIHARDLESYLGLRRRSATVNFSAGCKFAVSMKPDFGYRDQLVLYVYTFCAVRFSRVPTRVAQRQFVAGVGPGTRRFKWMSAREIEEDTRTRERNGDVLRAIHWLYGRSEVEVPLSFTRRIE